jgi:hypothetical protein
MRFVLCSARHALCTAVGFLPHEMLALWNSIMADLLRRILQGIHISLKHGNIDVDYRNIFLDGSGAFGN